MAINALNQKRHITSIQKADFPGNYSYVDSLDFRRGNSFGRERQYIGAFTGIPFYRGPGFLIGASLGLWQYVGVVAYLW